MLRLAGNRRDTSSVSTAVPTASASVPLIDHSPPTDKEAARFERDAARGYSINVKQVVLAFVVEFWIIGLIIVGTYLLITENDGDHVSREAFSALLLPAALAMVELARVPLAIAVRTQDAWHIKLLAAVGVLAAITVTSFSLSQIAWKTFDIRIAETVRAGDRLSEVRKKQETFQARQSDLQQELETKREALKDTNDRLAALQLQLTKIGSNTTLSCRPRIAPDGTQVVGQNGVAIKDCSPISTVSQPQLNALNAQIASTTKEADAARISIKQVESDIKKTEPQPVELELAKAEADYRIAVNKSQLHSYAGMIMGKAVAQVSESDVKIIERYLILIPSIAAAFASTLIAITAVRRLPPPTTTTLPDEAAQYLFGPLLASIKTEAQSMVAEAVSARGRVVVASG
jgi:hypothetical protein